MIRVVHPIPYPGIKKAPDPGSGSAAPVNTCPQEDLGADFWHPSFASSQIISNKNFKHWKSTRAKNVCSYCKSIINDLLTKSGTFLSEEI
jgi:hypothetical protein